MKLFFLLSTKDQMLYNQFATENEQFKGEKKNRKPNIAVAFMFLYVNLWEQLYMQVTNVRLQLYTYDTAFKKKV